MCCDICAINIRVGIRVRGLHLVLTLPRLSFHEILLSYKIPSSWCWLFNGELIWLVVYLPLWKIWKSNGSIIPNIYIYIYTYIYIYIYRYTYIYIYRYTYIYIYIYIHIYIWTNKTCSKPPTRLIVTQLAFFVGISLMVLLFEWWWSANQFTNGAKQRRHPSTPRQKWLS